MLASTVSYHPDRARGVRCHAARALVVIASMLASTGCVPGRPAPVTPTGAAASSTTGVESYVSSLAGDRLTAHPLPGWGAAGPGADGTAEIVVDDGTRYQSMVGFGASFLEAGLVTLDTLPTAAAQDQVLRALFDPVTGAGFSVMKTVIGGTDFQSARQEWFTYDDVPGDTGLAHFSIDRDLGPHGEVTYIRRARAAGGRFVLEAPMDYPPDWMLTEPAVPDHQDVDPAYYPVLARYYLRYLDAYRQQGVSVDYLALFNEPGVYTKISPEEVDVLLRDHVGPLLRARAPGTRLMPSEVPNRSGAAEFYAPLLADPGSRPYIDVLAYHGYWGNGAEAVAALHAQAPRYPLFMTEICCMPDLPGSDDPRRDAWSTGQFWAGQIIADLRAGASAWVYWNMILDSSGGPWLVSPSHVDFDGNAQNAVVHIDRASHAVTYTPLYYYLAHFSRYVRPGAVRISTTGTGLPGDVLAVAFRNADGSLVLELANGEDRPVPLALRWRDRLLPVTLAARSMTTVRWR